MAKDSRVSARAAGRGARKPAVRNAPGRPTSVELERRKGEIMKTATALFIKEGYAATSLVDIAKNAGVATRTLYQHYGDKEALFENVMYARETAAVLPPPEAPVDASLFESLLLIAEYICEVTFRPITVDMMRLAISESQRFPLMMRKLMERSQLHFNANVRGYFDDLASRRLIVEGDTSLAAEMFINLVLGTTPLLVFGGWKASVPTREQLEQRIDLFIMGRWGAAAARKARAIPAKRGASRPVGGATGKPETTEAGTVGRGRSSKVKAAASA